MVKLDYVLTSWAPIQVLTDEGDRLKSEENSTLISSIFLNLSFIYGVGKELFIICIECQLNETFSELIQSIYNVRGVEIACSMSHIVASNDVDTFSMAYAIVCTSPKQVQHMNLTRSTEPRLAPYQHNLQGSENMVVL